MIEVGHASHTGLRRELNEDTYWADADLGLFLVVDGMGGYGRGEVAAAIARDALVDAARAGGDLVAAIRNAGNAIATFASATAGTTPAGAALALLRIERDQYAVARIGDARVYLRHHGIQQSLCRGNPDAVPDPDTTAGDVVESGSPTPRRNRITQALGITPMHELYAEPACGTLERGMQFLLCSDGLSEELDDARIAAVLARTDLAAQECVDHLLLAALGAGGRDNISIVLVRVS
ncbi:MAG TPA: protein phosphatase 2C domain-containing protein [Rhodanobacteraceae bacterium]|nr:protein phosphatase 2C domain-containing protein [Rhodanobacteraceae bacterium]